MRKIVLTYGLIAGAMLGAMMGLTIPFMDRIGFDHGMLIGYTTMVIAFLMVYFGVRTYRDDVTGGTIGFGQAFKVGLLIMLVGSLCYVLAWEVIYTNFASDFMEKYTAFALDKARAAGKSAAEVATMAQEMAAMGESYKNPLIRAAFTLLEPLPVGLLVALFSAIILSRKRSVA